MTSECEHDWEEGVQIEVLGPPSLGIRKPDGSVDIVDTDGEGRDIRKKGTILGSRCRKCGATIPTNTCSLPPETLKLKYVVVVTERDQYGKEVKVVTKGCRFRTPEGGSVVVLDAQDREIAAWPRGRWTKAHMKLEGADG